MIDSECMLVTKARALASPEELARMFEKKNRSIFETEMNEFICFDDYMESLEYFNPHTMRVDNGGLVVKEKNYNIEASLDYDECQKLAKKLSEGTSNKVVIEVSQKGRKRFKIDNTAFECSVINEYKFIDFSVVIDEKYFISYLKDVEKECRIFISIKNDRSNIFFAYSERCYVIIPCQN